MLGVWPANPACVVWSDSDVSKIDLTSIDGDLKGFIGGFASGNFGYLVPYHNGAYHHGKLVRFELATFSNVQVLDLTATDGALKGFLGGFASGGDGYLVPHGDWNGAKLGKVVRIAAV